MAQKALAMAMIGCNLIKAVSQEAADLKGANIRHVSFKGALDEITSGSANFRGRTRHRIKCGKLYQDIVNLVSERLLEIRPFRREPRAVKKRPKQYPWLMVARSAWKVDRAA